MSRRALSLPIRALSHTASPNAQWVCRRCLATQADQNSSASLEAPFIPVTAGPSFPSVESAQRPVEEKSQVRDWRTLNLFNLGKPLPHPVPRQHLQYCDKEALTPEEETLQQQVLKITPRKRVRGVVVATGKLNKTVRVRIPGQVWNKKIGKWFDQPKTMLVHDENNSSIEGDIVELHNLRVSSAVRSTIGAILVPFSKAIEDRPPIETPEERLHKYKIHRFAKIERREVRKRAEAGDESAISELRSRELAHKAKSGDIAKKPKKHFRAKKKFG